ncbi:LacI family DNA-binding transcriptional regulator [Athalassotoga saccharophila]|uniref:LacI family DNA-binding transcriptional regulator n=1 Tax=Athalassotoga saccharophila TaxID=1441386 RepID=UPI001379E95F|nr:LacI family DNA-binding transcriptional regulator [Athalassotoga saccharophila]BBJ28034.1 HTH-type transcriptional repressor CytR [Athalassotoga saccharophila]
MVSIKDVAKIAGVSIATVSRVFNSPQLVSPRTRAMVYSVAQKLNYIPNYSAKTLRKSIVGSIIVLIPDVSNLFFIDVVHGVQDYAESRDYNVLMGRFNISIFNVEKYFQLVKSKAADGIVLATGHDRVYPKISDAQNVNIVTIEEPYMDNPYVYIDNFKAIKQVIDYLLSKGHRRFGFIGFKSERSRFTAFKKIIKENGIEYDEGLVRLGEETAEDMPESARIYIKNLVEKKKIPDAIVCASDVLAAGAIKWLIKSGLRVPEDVSVTGFDGIDIVNLVTPSITTVDQPRHRMGMEAAKILINKIEGKDFDEKVRLPTRLIIGESA